MVNSVFIRPAQKSDFEDLFPMLVDLFSLHISEKEILADKKYYREHYYYLISQQDTLFFVAEDNNHLVGFLEGSSHLSLWCIKKKKVFVLETLVVQKEKRSLGVGKQLLNYFEKLVEKMGGELVELYSSKSRLDAHRFYEKNGYEKNGFRFAKKL